MESMTQNTSVEQMNTLTSLGAYSVRKLEDATKLDLADNQYLVRKIERNSGLDSTAVVIPATTAEQFVEYLRDDAILAGAVAWYQSQVAEVCKARMTAGRASLIDDDFHYTEVAKYISECEVREGRISKEKIATWFDASVAPSICEVFAEKLGTQFTDDMRGKVLEQYRAQFKRLTTKDLTLESDVKGSLLKACGFAPAESAVRQYCEKQIKAAKLPESMLKLI